MLLKWLESLILKKPEIVQIPISEMTKKQVLNEISALVKKHGSFYETWFSEDAEKLEMLLARFDQLFDEKFETFTMF